MAQQPDHELEVLEDDQNVPPRPEEDIADADSAAPASDASRGSDAPPLAPTRSPHRGGRGQLARLARG